VYLKVGDVVELGIDGLGRSRQRVAPFEMKRYVLTLDLKDDPRAIADTRPITARSGRRSREACAASGVRAMDIYALGRRLTMVMDTRDDFDLKRSFAAHVRSDPRCAEWEA
jgi:L-rhamnose mutarotase